MPQLLREYYALCPDGACQINLLTEDEKRLKENGAVLLTGVFQVGDAKNQNGRIYPLRVLQREMKLYQKLIDEGRAVGECDHSEQSELLLKNVSHVVLRTWWEGNKLLGVLKLLPTPNGKIVESLVNSKIPLGISSRALGSLRESAEGSVVQDDLNLISFDVVVTPSVNSAFLSLMESKRLQNTIFTKSDRINRLLYDLTGK